MAKYDKPQAGEDGWTDWIDPARHYKLACCDCGLVHNVEFRVIVTTRKRNGRFKMIRANPKNCRVQFRVSRNNRATGQIRRHEKEST